MPRKQVGAIDEQLLAEVDRQADTLGQTRRVFVERALRARLGRVESEDKALASARAIVAQPERYAESTVKTATEALGEPWGVKGEDAEQALASEVRRSEDPGVSLPSLPAPAEQPDARAMDLLREDDPDPDFIARGRVPEFPPPSSHGPLSALFDRQSSSSQAKRDVRPVPKRGEK